MSSNETLYSVRLRYAMQGNAGRELDTIGQKASVAERSAFGLRSALAVVGVGTALAAGKRMFVDYNSSVEQAKIGLAATLMMLKGGDWTSNIATATTMHQRYQQVAKASVGTTEDFMTMNNAIAASALKAGLSLDQLQKMTTGAVVAGSVFGERADMVSLDIKQMLAGTVGARDRTAQILLATQNVSQDKFNAMNQAQRNKVITSALNNPALKAAAKAMENSFAGVTSTLKDNIQIAVGGIGLPLFKAITAEIKKWNAWIEKHPREIEAFAKSFASALVSGFNVVKNVAGFIVEHKDLFLTLAKAWAISKGVGAISGGIGGMLGGGDVGGQAGAAGAVVNALKGAGVGYAVGSYVNRGMHDAWSKVSESSHVVVGALATLPGPLGALAKAAGLAAGIIDTYFEGKNAEIDALNERIAKAEFGTYGVARVKEFLTADQGDTKEEAQRYLLRRGAAIGAITATANAQGYADVQLDRAKLAAAIASDPNIVNEQKALALVAVERAYADMKANIAQERGFGDELLLLAAKRNPTGEVVADPSKSKNAKPADVNVHISKIEVASDDPDRFVIGMVRAVSKVRQNPTQAASAIGNI